MSLRIFTGFNESSFFCRTENELTEAVKFLNPGRVPGYEIMTDCLNDGRRRYTLKGSARWCSTAPASEFTPIIYRGE